MGHYFVVTINMKKERFELLDSSTAYPGTIEFFNNVTSKLMKIWKHISTELQLSEKKHRPFQKGQTAGATSRRRHVSTSKISLVSFFQCKIHYYNY